MRAIQSFGRSETAGQIFRGRNQTVLDAELTAVRVQARWMPVPDVVLAIGSALVLVVGGNHVVSGALSTGGLLVVLSYLRDLYSPVRGLTRLSTVLAKAGASAARVGAVLDCDEAVARGRARATRSPAAHAGSSSRTSASATSQAATWSPTSTCGSAPARRCAWWGRAAVGKSTALHLLLRLYDVDSGRVLVDGVDVRDCDLRSLRSRFAYMPQEPWLLDATLAENIALGNPAPPATRSRPPGSGPWCTSSWVGCRDGFDTRLGEAGARLSGGERRRVALARAAISTAPRWCCSTNRRRPSTRCRPRASSAPSATRPLGRTTLIVTHDPAVTALADRVITVGSETTVGSSARPSPSDAERR